MPSKILFFFFCGCCKTPFPLLFKVYNICRTLWFFPPTDITSNFLKKTKNKIEFCEVIWFCSCSFEQKTIKPFSLEITCATTSTATLLTVVLTHRRHDGVISSLYDGTQCSSCGLRFPGEAAKIYREHLDWHFRKNRREKDGRRVAHRQWFYTVKDWLNYEEISDPEERGAV